MKLGIIAGNRLLPLLLARRIKEKEPQRELIAFGFKHETSPHLKKIVDRMHWLPLGQLSALQDALAAEGIQQCVLIGQISPWRIFNQSNWDEALLSLVKQAGDFRPHTIFCAIIAALEKQGVEFLDSTLYLGEDLADSGVMNGLMLDEDLKKDIEFGLRVISRYTELDIGQTIAVKKSSVVALEALEGTDRAVQRAARLAGRGCTILKFSKPDQDMRFDVPVVGLSTLRLLRRVGAASIVLERNKVIILDREQFLSKARAWRIPVVGS